MKKSQMVRIVEFDKEVRFRLYPNRFDFSMRNGISDRTVARDVEYLRDRLRAPLEYDSDRKGYYYSKEWVLPSVFTLSAMNEMDWVDFLIEQIKTLSESGKDMVFRSIGYGSEDNKSIPSVC